MIKLGNVLVSDELLAAYFVCDLADCKGACCVEGDAGAPLDKHEIDLIEEDYQLIKPFLNEKGRKTIDKTGVFTIDVEGEYVTPLNNGKECAFTIFEKNGIAKCGIEAAFHAGKTTFRKPSSCHLYPIRVTKLNQGEALNYHQWPICKPACECGSKLQVKVYQFLKEPLIQKYGEAWFEELKKIDEQMNEVT